MNTFRILVLIVLTATTVNGQKYDSNWLFSNEWWKKIGAECYGKCDGIIMNFSDTGMKLTPKSLKMNLIPTNGTISDKDGNLQFYTNGMQIRNYLTERIDNGDTLNNGQFAKNYDIDDNYRSWRNVSIIPDEDTIGLYYLYHGISGFTSPTGYQTLKNVLITKVDMRKDDGRGKVVSINHEKKKIDYNQKCMVRHANGRFWWSILDSGLPREYSTILFEKDSLLSTITQTPDIFYVDGLAPVGSQKNVSLDGSYYLDVSPVGVRIFMFDRCTGKLELARKHRYPPTPYGQTWQGRPFSIAMSPNNRFVYMGTDTFLYQYDMEAPDFEKSQVKVGGPFFAYYGELSQANDTFAVMNSLSNGPDGKIYFSSYYGTTDLFVVNRPNEKGMNCDVCRKGCTNSPFYMNSAQNFPNYRLGPLKGSPCDTLNVANKEIGMKDYGLKLMPNPASDQIQLDITLPEYDLGAKTDIVILNVAGEVVIKYPMPDFAYLANVDISALASGVYAVQLRQRNQVMAVEKLVVVR